MKLKEGAICHFNDQESIVSDLESAYLKFMCHMYSV